jgi:hypothetical protein
MKITVVSKDEEQKKLSKEITVGYYKNHMNHKNTFSWRSIKQTVHAVTAGF